MVAEFRAERDTIVGLGLLASTYLHFDTVVPRGGESSHWRGFNVHSIVVDNQDGEVLAIDYNRIHATSDPLQHAEQRCVRRALRRLGQKRPRSTGITPERHYKESLFMAPGKEQGDFINRGCTLYNTFDPCGMCATTLLVCYMKRVAYLFADKKFADVYDSMRKYFSNRESVKESHFLVSLEGEGNHPLRLGARLITELRELVEKSEAAGTPLVMTLDGLRERLGETIPLLAGLRPSHLTTSTRDRERNSRTLEDLQRWCRL